LNLIQDIYIYAGKISVWNVG